MSSQGHQKKNNCIIYQASYIGLSLQVGWSLGNSNREKYSVPLIWLLISSIYSDYVSEICCIDDCNTKSDFVIFIFEEGGKI